MMECLLRCLMASTKSSDEVRVGATRPKSYIRAPNILPWKEIEALNSIATPTGSSDSIQNDLGWPAAGYTAESPLQWSLAWKLPLSCWPSFSIDGSQQPQASRSDGSGFVRPRLGMGKATMVKLASEDDSNFKTVSLTLLQRCLLRPIIVLIQKITTTHRFVLCKKYCSSSHTCVADRYRWISK